ncbi:MAG TPA: hypothetical protein VFT22_29590, partial [Kofleriaceae bacterium]|nr:hypothetical protein [Kofleriaceae bacterium]
IAIAFAITLVIELSAGTGSGPAALITCFVLCVLVQEGRDGSGRLRWSTRVSAAATSIETVQRPPGDAGDPYAALLADVPPGATVAVWVSEPERLDYERHHLVDLRTPAGARLRVHRWDAHPSAFEPLLAALGASYVLIERDDAGVLRTQTDLLYRLACAAPRRSCADDLEVLALDHPVVARRGNLALVALGRTR